MGWTNVDKKLPDKDGDYLVYDVSGNVFSAYYDSNIDNSNERFGVWEESFDSHSLGSLGSDWYPFNDITHWMILPEPPEDDKGEG